MRLRRSFADSRRGEEGRTYLVGLVVEMMAFGLVVYGVWGGLLRRRLASGVVGKEGLWDWGWMVLLRRI